MEETKQEPQFVDTMNQITTIEESKEKEANAKLGPQSSMSEAKRLYLDPATNQLLRKMYSQQFPDIISTILRLKHSRKIIDNDCKRLVENINGRFLRTVI